MLANNTYKNGKIIKSTKLEIYNSTSGNYNMLWLCIT